MTLDLVGQTFGRLTAIGRAGVDKYRNSLWRCVCQCGAVVTIKVYSLRSGATRSCGCLQRESVARASTTHGMTDSPEWRSWKAMKGRCENQKRDDYERYGGRGIRVCDRWLSFDNFYADMGPRPDGCSVDRVENDGNYEPSNCRWATPKQQSDNRRAPRRGRVER